MRQGGVMHLPGPLRAAVGLVASAAQEARHLPDRAIELPMVAVSTALQVSLRAQQRYARLAARGDAVLNRRRPTDEPPAWATFDEPVPVEELRRAALDQLTELAGDPVGDAPTPQVPKPAAKKPATKAAPKRAKAAPRKTTSAKVPDKPPARNGRKSVSKPRHTAPSRFDDAGDDAGDA